jgi:hypothetical protein
MGTRVFQLGTLWVESTHTRCRGCGPRWTRTTYLRVACGTFPWPRPPTLQHHNRDLPRSVTLRRQEPGHVVGQLTVEQVPLQVASDPCPGREPGTSGQLDLDSRIHDEVVVPARGLRRPIVARRNNEGFPGADVGKRNGARLARPGANRRQIQEVDAGTGEPISSRTRGTTLVP